MEAVRELRRCVTELGFLGLRVIPWLWEAPPTDRRYYPLYAACVELGVPFCTQVGHTGPLRPSETGRPIPYIDQVAIDFPELVIVVRPHRLPVDRGDGRGRPQARERLHRHLGLHRAPLPARARRATCAADGGSRKVLFGSNFPMIAPAAGARGPRRAELDDETQELFLHANAERVFGL